MALALAGAASLGDVRRGVTSRVTARSGLAWQVAACPWHGSRGKYWIGAARLARLVGEWSGKFWRARAWRGKAGEVWRKRRTNRIAKATKEKA